MQYFIKYNSIINHYEKPTIEKYLRAYPNLTEDVWIAQEKLDGANISLVFAPELDFPVVCSRKRILKPNENFYDIWNVLQEEEIKNFINLMLDKSKKTNSIYRFYGELFGFGIQKRINYGDKRYIRFFDMSKNDERFSPEKMSLFFNENEISNLLVPTVQINTLDNLLKIDIENQKSLFAKSQGIDDYMEGIVLKPYKEIFFYKRQDLIVIKYKSKKFTEKMNQKHKIKKEGNPDVIFFNEKFKAYLTENRILSVFSKEGEIESSKEIGKYIKLILDDMKEEFYRNLTNEEKFKLDNLSKEDTKNVFKIGHLIVHMLKKYFLK